jgi:hypothetical protein
MSKHTFIIVIISIIAIHNYPDTAVQDREKVHLSSRNCKEQLESVRISGEYLTE